MARPGHPWRNEDKGNAWYAKIGGRKVRLADADATELQAREAYVEALRKEDAPRLGVCNHVKTLADLFLDHIQQDHPASYGNYRRVLQSFCDANPGLTVYVLDMKHVTRWLEAQPTWGESTRSLAVAVLMACLNWALRPPQKLIPTNPIAGMPRPRIRSRGEEALVDRRDHATLRALASRPVQDVLEALQLTGTRSINLFRAQVEDVDWERGAIVLEKHKTARATGRKLYIPIPASLVPLLERLCHGRTSGPLFRNSRGNAWGKSSFAAVLCRLRRKAEQAGKPLHGHPTAVGYRHTVATELLEAGVPDAKVAAILGHRNTKMIYHHYGHLTSKIRGLAADMDRVLSGDADTGPAAPAPEAGA